MAIWHFGSMMGNTLLGTVKLRALRLGEARMVAYALWMTTC